MLRQKAQPIYKIDWFIKDKVKEMLDILRTTPNGVGLAANQIGLLKRVFISNYGGAEEVYINPVITSINNEQDILEEECLSLPSVKVSVPRYCFIIIKYQNLLGEIKNREVWAMEARVLQHEMDHLNGRLITDYVEQL